MNIRALLLELRTSPLRRGLAVGALVLASGGLVLLHTPRTSGIRPAQAEPTSVTVSGPSTVQFKGDGAHGTLALSHGAVLGSSARRVYAELTLKASEDGVRQRAPVSLVVALDVSGSMSGEKIQQAKDAVAKLVREMHDDDEVALLTYSDSATIRQPLAPVGKVRRELLEQIKSIESGGGTNIPSALEAALKAVQESSEKRVRRLILVSDGLDNGRAQSEATVKRAVGQGIAVSSLGVGLDFNESYMASLAQVGRGNFAFVKEGAELATFLRKELDESSTTRITNASVRLDLPRGLALAQVAGATAVQQARAVELQLGSLFAGEERRVIVELIAQADQPGSSPILGDFSWHSLRGDHRVKDNLQPLTLLRTSDPEVESRSINGAVLASATSVLASVRQIEATEAYARGDVGRAQALTRDNEIELRRVQAVAPEKYAKILGSQADSYKQTNDSFRASPSSAEGKTAAKRAYQQDVKNFKVNSY